MSEQAETNRDDEKIVKKNRIKLFGKKKDDPDAPPKEKDPLRVRRIFVLIASFIVNGLVFGIINSVSVIFNEIQKNMKAAGDENSATKGSFVMSLSIGMTFFLSPVAGILTDIIGIRLTTFIGGSLAISGLLLSSFFPTNVEVLYFSFGILLGVGESLAYTPSLVILGHYFTKYLGLANGIVTTGSCVFTLAYPYILQWLIETYNLKGCFLGLMGAMLLLWPCAFVFKPVLPKSNLLLTSDKKCLDKCKEIINVENWKRPRYVIWAMAIPVALFGYFVSFIHIVAFVEHEFNKEYDGKIMIQCIAITSFFGRLVSGKAADFRWVSPIYLQQMAIYFMGFLTMLMPVVHNYYALVVICLFLGFFDGFFVTLMGPVAFRICGKKGASQGIGFTLGLCAIPITLGSPIAGFMFDKTKTYLFSFLSAGAMFLLGASLIFIIRCVKEPPPPQDEINIDEVNAPLNPEPIPPPITTPQEANGGRQW